MYKFIKQYTEKMDYATIYPIISLLIFFLFFVVLLVLVKKMDKQKIVELSNIPLDINETTTSIN
ncbi:MAG: CcoQ/FixQ family Cbb3-type cytochrome c oxidase assembly chaperone [Ferruginibacter sp.]|nr:CcoQ/FixQ family Cbb3-type cytochrome c oxidase assembly chaperone [Ferruginibacter sp.]